MQWGHTCTVIYNHRVPDTGINQLCTICTQGIKSPMYISILVTILVTHHPIPLPLLPGESRSMSLITGEHTGLPFGLVNPTLQKKGISTANTQKNVKSQTRHPICFWRIFGKDAWQIGIVTNPHIWSGIGYTWPIHIEFSAVSKEIDPTQNRSYLNKCTTALPF